MELGLFGVWTTFSALGEENGAEAAALAQGLGFGTFWLGGSPRLPALRPLLMSADQITVATGIVNVRQHEPAELAAEYAQLAPDFGDRLLVGLGVGQPEAPSDYRQPLPAMRSALDALDQAPTPLPVDHRCLAALGPRMLKLAAARSLGAHTYFMPVDHTRFARQLLGPAPLIATEVACVIDRDSVSAREAARAYAKPYLAVRNFTRNLLEFGFSERDLADGGSDWLIDAVVPHGAPEEIGAVAEDHLEAGADHVCLQPVGVTGIPRREWTALADVLAPPAERIRRARRTMDLGVAGRASPGTADVTKQRRRSGQSITRCSSPC
jgi:probable F420-dependent oxidoreductase